MATSTKRLKKELTDLMQTPPTGISVTLQDESDLHKWKVVIEGPSGTPFVHGAFNALLTFPEQYPFRPPTLVFSTKIYHPNISTGPTSTITTASGNPAPGEAGMVCLGMLRADEWKPSTKISNVLTFTRDLLRDPLPDDAVEARIADEFLNHRAAWEKEARDWTKRYAIGKPTGVN